MISLDWTLLLQFFNFVVLLFIMNKFLYRPLRAIMTQRQEKIVGGHAKARDLESEIEAKMQTYQDQLSAAKAEAANERVKLRKVAHQQESEITGAARQEAAARVQSIREQVEKEAAEAGQTLKGETEALAGQIAAKVLGRELA